MLYITVGDTNAYVTLSNEAADKLGARADVSLDGGFLVLEPVESGGLKVQRKASNRHILNIRGVDAQLFELTSMTPTPRVINTQRGFRIDVSAFLADAPPKPEAKPEVVEAEEVVHKSDAEMNASEAAKAVRVLNACLRRFPGLLVATFDNNKRVEVYAKVN